jgi:hypothetical protein
VDSNKQPKQKYQAKQKTPKSSDGDFKDIIKIMADTPPISNEELVKRSKKNKT